MCISWCYSVKKGQQPEQLFYGTLFHLYTTNLVSIMEILVLWAE